MQAFIQHGNTAGESGFSSVDTTSVAQGVGGEIAFHGKYNTGAQDWAYFGHIRGIKENATNGNTACALTFHTRPNATAPQERVRITSDGFIGINDTTPYNGLSINKEGDYWDTNGNTYAHPVGRVLSSWRGDRNDNTDYWVGFVGKYMKPSATVNILLQPHVGNFGNQAGMYIAGEATSATASDFTVGKIVSGSATGQGTSGNVRATKSELFRITSAGLVGVGTANPTGMLEVQKNGVPAIIANYNNQKHLQMGAGGSGAGFHLTTGNFFTINHQPYADRGTDNNLTERLRIDSTGRISSGKHGVGTHNDANEWFKVQSNDSAANISIVASNDTHSSLNLGDEDDFNIQKIRSDHTNNSLQFFTADAERLRIGSSGQIGLGGANYGTSGQVLTSQGSGSAVQWASPSSGLAMADQWRRTATLNTSNAENFITTDWARVSGGGFGTLGTGMSESGGIFTFPSTGTVSYTHLTLPTKRIV